LHYVVDVDDDHTGSEWRHPEAIPAAIPPPISADYRLSISVFLISASVYHEIMIGTLLIESFRTTRREQREDRRYRALEAQD
jgi:hypothetical protein